VGRTQRLLGKIGSGSEWMFALAPNGAALLQLDRTRPSATLSGTTSIADGKWHHVAATWDGTVAKIYVDGRVDASAAIARTHPFTSRTFITIGGDPFGTFLRGALDEVAMYDRALGEAQIAQHYAMRTSTA